HQPHIGTDEIPNRSNTVVVVLDAVAAGDSTHLEFNCVEALLNVALNLFDELFGAFAFAVVAACDINRDTVSIPTDELVKRKANGLRPHIIKRRINRGHG